VRQKARLIQLQTATKPSGIVTPQQVALYIEENEDLYIDQVKVLEGDYGGKLVINKKLARGLLANVRKHIARTGTVPEVLRPSNFPLEEFVPVQLKFSIPVLGMDAEKFYFFRKVRVFIAGGRD
jgi:hypothetical protein